MEEEGLRSSRWVRIVWGVLVLLAAVSGLEWVYGHGLLVGALIKGAAGRWDVNRVVSAALLLTIPLLAVDGALVLRGRMWGRGMSVVLQIGLVVWIVDWFGAAHRLRLLSVKGDLWSWATVMVFWVGVACLAAASMSLGTQVGEDAGWARRRAGLWAAVGICLTGAGIYFLVMP